MNRKNIVFASLFAVLGGDFYASSSPVLLTTPQKGVETFISTLKENRSANVGMLFSNLPEEHKKLLCSDDYRVKVPVVKRHAVAQLCDAWAKDKHATARDFKDLKTVGAAKQKLERSKDEAKKRAAAFSMHDRNIHGNIDATKADLSDAANATRDRAAAYSSRDGNIHGNVDEARRQFTQRTTSDHPVRTSAGSMRIDLPVAGGGSAREFSPRALSPRSSHSPVAGGGSARELSPRALSPRSSHSPVAGGGSARELSPRALSPRSSHSPVAGGGSARELSPRALSPRSSHSPVAGGESFRASAPDSAVTDSLAQANEAVRAARVSHLDAQKRDLMALEDFSITNTVEPRNPGGTLYFTDKFYAMQRLSQLLEAARQGYRESQKAHEAAGFIDQHNHAALEAANIEAQQALNLSQRAIDQAQEAAAEAAAAKNKGNHQGNAPEPREAHASFSASTPAKAVSRLREEHLASQARSAQELNRDFDRIANTSDDKARAHSEQLRAEIESVRARIATTLEHLTSAQKAEEEARNLRDFLNRSIAENRQRGPLDTKVVEDIRKEINSAEDAAKKSADVLQRNINEARKALDDLTVALRTSSQRPSSGGYGGGYSQSTMGERKTSHDAARMGAADPRSDDSSSESGSEKSEDILTVVERIEKNDGYAVRIQPLIDQKKLLEGYEESFSLLEARVHGIERDYMTRELHASMMILDSLIRQGNEGLNKLHTAHNALESHAQGESVMEEMRGSSDPGNQSVAQTFYNTMRDLESDKDNAAHELQQNLARIEEIFRVISSHVDLKYKQ
ncbi:MAG: hypothetical protein H6849_04080 [Alphaproteobacteria bacterium]|nr:MAG: hypothetical protein H6849_04080 [Alphaproteobacteria bacterium]